MRIIFHNGSGIILPIWLYVLIMMSFSQQSYGNHTMDGSELCEMNITVDKGMINYQSCVSSIKIDTMFGAFKLSCLEIKNFRLFGPGTIVDREEICHVNGLPMCGIGTGSRNKFSTNCENEGFGLEIGLLLIFGVTLCIQYSIIRYLWITKVKTIKSYLILSKRGGIINFKLEVHRFFTDEPVTYVKREKPKLIIDSPSVRFIHYDWKKLLIALLFFIHPTPTTAKPQDTLLSLSEKHVMELELQSGHWVTLGQSHFNIPWTSGELMLNHLYETGEFNYTTVKDWHCYQSSCNSHGPCGESGQFGLIENHKLWHDTIINGSLIYRQRFCEWGTTGCFYSDGCWKWVVEHRILEDQLWSVFGIKNMRFNPRTVDFKEESCKLVMNQIPSLLNIVGNSILKSPNDDYYYCPFPHNRLRPIKGEIGDIQIYKNREFIVAPDKISCIKDEVNGPKCDIIELKFKELLANCEQLPSMVDGYQLRMTSNGADFIYKEPETVIMTCKNEIDLKISSEECGGVVWDLWYKEGGEDLMRAHGRTKQVHDGRSILVQAPCDSKLVLLDCSESGVTLSLSWSKECILSGNFTYKTIVTNEDIQIFKDLVDKGHFSIEHSETFFSKLLDWFSNPLGISMSSLNVLFLIGFAILILK